MTEFVNGSVPIRVAARVYKKDPEWVREGIILGWLPIGYATCKGQLVTTLSGRSGRTNYYISPKKLYEDTGYVWKGELS